MILVECTGTKRAEEKKPSTDWTTDFLQKYRENPKIKQIIAVQYKGGSEAKVQMCEKSTEQGKIAWTLTLSCDGVIGKEGIGKKKEGDNKTPTGDFGVSTAFGIKKNPGTKLPYVDVTDDTYCCNDKNYYNQIIDIKKYPHDCSEGEHMIEYTPAYNYGMFLDYNKECKPGKGSAIFFHCFGAKPYTAGCIAVSEENMSKILKSIDSEVRVVIDKI